MSERYDAGTKIQGRKQKQSKSTDATATPLDITEAKDRPDEDHQLVLWDILVSVAVTMRLTFRDEDAGGEFYEVYIAADTPAQISPRAGLRCPTAGKGIEVVSNAAGDISITAIYSPVRLKE